MLICWLIYAISKSFNKLFILLVRLLNKSDVHKIKQLHKWVHEFWKENFQQESAKDEHTCVVVLQFCECDLYRKGKKGKKNLYCKEYKQIKFVESNAWPVFQVQFILRGNAEANIYHKPVLRISYIRYHYVDWIYK